MHLEPLTTIGAMRELHYRDFFTGSPPRAGRYMPGPALAAYGSA